MVGIVLVSHSQTLADGALELIHQMAPAATVALAAGTENPDEPIGTDPMRVYTAIEAVYSDDGVLVLMDLGSAIMSAEAAIEFLEPERQEQIYLCEAPLVEGGLAAAVVAAGGAPLTRVLAEARAALPGKLSQLEPVLRSKPEQMATVDSTVRPVEADSELSLTVPNRLGLHARPAARIVELVNHFSATATVRKEERIVDAASITSLLTLGVRHGDTITIAATGPQASQLLAAIEELSAQNFGDVPDLKPSPESADALSLSSLSSSPIMKEMDEKSREILPVSQGVAVGPALLLIRQVSAPTHESISDVLAEQARFAAALQQTQEELAQLETMLANRVMGDEAGILAAQRLILMDSTLQQAVHDQIAAEAVNAAWAWQSAIDAIIADYELLEDSYLRRRAADVRDVGNRLLRQLSDDSSAANFLTTMNTPAIVVATELTPSESALLDPALVLGIVTESGGVTGHAAIIARSLGIPAVTGATDLLTQVRAGQMIALNGSTGELWLTLTDAEIDTLQAERASWLAERAAMRKLAKEAAITQDGVRIEVAANIGGAAEVAPAVAAGAEGVGLFRTEFLFMGRATAPDEEMQFQAYRAATEALGDRPLLIRTLDVGGDKPLPYLAIPAEENPFLGWRGIRYCLDNPDFFRTQLRAILRAGHGHQIQVMFPMVSTVAEVQRARALLQEEKRALTTAGIATAENMAIGIMIETPAAVLNARQLAAAVDFFSIGTNDLTQYLMAADRGNSRVADLIDPLQPPVIAAIAQVAEAAHVAKIWVGVCGELAGEPLVTPLLLGLGINELSMSAPAIGAVKAVIRKIEHAAAVDLAHYLLTLPDAKAVRAALQQFVERGGR